MKKTNNIGRRLGSIILALALMLGMTTNVFAGWETYNSGISANGVYLQETWIGGKQCINFWKNGEWVRNIASEGHTLWINSIPVLYSLYDTQHWCYDQYGNCFAIDSNQKLLLCRVNSTGFVVNNSITGCTGFARDNNKVGYLLYTNNGNYNLSDLLNGKNLSGVETGYPCVKQEGIYMCYYKNYNDYYRYSISGSTLVYNGNNSRNMEIALVDFIDHVTFTYGYIVFSDTNGNVYAIPIGKTSRLYKIKLGDRFDYFLESSKNWSSGFYRYGGEYVNFVDKINMNSYNQHDNEYSNEYYPFIKHSGDYFYYYVSKSKYYQYYLRGSSLYYKGTNNSRSDTLIAKSVDEITFYDGYIVYALSSGKVYKLEVGKTSSSYKKQIGTKFSYFDEYDYMSEGYYDTNDRYINFDDRYDTDEDYPYVEKSGNYYYYYKSNTKTYEYCLKNSTLYYDGERLETSVRKVTFSDKGYIIYATTSGYVYAYPVGKTSSSYRKYIGKYFDYFDDDDYMSEGYYDEYYNYVDFDF